MSSRPRYDRAKAGGRAILPDMHFVIGLGNPGASYAATRHNIGWMVLDELCRQLDCTPLERMKAHQADVRRLLIKEAPVWCVYPHTFMNRSGETVRSLWRDDPAATVIVVHDDVALPIGELRISYGRGHGGHNGIRNIIDQCKTKDFVRIRMGVASRSWFGGAARPPSGQALPRHVLGRFSLFEQTTLRTACDRGVIAIRDCVLSGYEVAMNTHNAPQS